MAANTQSKVFFWFFIGLTIVALVCVLFGAKHQLFMASMSFIAAMSNYRELDYFKRRKALKR